MVKGMILNGLGLVSSPLYLFSRFFEGKATEHLLGKGIKAEYLNDDRLDSQSRLSARPGYKPRRAKAKPVDRISLQRSSENLWWNSAKVAGG